MGSGIFGIIAWQSFIYALAKNAIGELSETLLIPKAPFIILLALGSAITAVIFFIAFIDRLEMALDKSRRAIRLGLVFSLGVSVLIIIPEVWIQYLPRVSTLTVGIVGMALLLLLLFSGLPVGVVMALVGFLGIAYLRDITGALSVLGQVPYSTAENHSLSTIPLFVLMGLFAFHSGVSRDMYDATYKLFGHFPGGLAMATVAGCAGFGAVTGSSVATAATMGTIAIPEMKRYNYDMGLATGCVAAGGTIAGMIPPSTALIVYAFLTEQSIGRLFMAGVFPGLLEATIYMATIYVLCKANPLKGPPGPRFNFRQKIGAFKRVWPVMLLFFLVLGGLYLGVFTPTEAGGIGACGAFIVGLSRGRLRWQGIINSLVESGKTTAMIFLIIIGAMILGFFLSYTRLPFLLADFVSNLEINRWFILGIILLVYLFLGCLMDGLAMMLITIPIFFPVVVALGFDPIWFGIVMHKVGEIALITPPIGMTVFVIASVTKDVSLYTIFRGILPFVVADLINLSFLLAFPSISLFLPNLMKGTQ